MNGPFWALFGFSAPIIVAAIMLRIRARPRRRRAFLLDWIPAAVFTEVLAILTGITPMADGAAVSGVIAAVVLVWLNRRRRRRRTPRAVGYKDRARLAAVVGTMRARTRPRSAPLPA